MMSKQSNKLNKIEDDHARAYSPNDIDRLWEEFEKEFTRTELQAELKRLDPDYFGDFTDEDWDLWIGAASDGMMEKFALRWAESQAALREIAEGQHGYFCAWKPDTNTGVCNCHVSIARNACKGGSNG